MYAAAHGNLLAVPFDSAIETARHDEPDIQVVADTVEPQSNLALRMRHTDGHSLQLAEVRANQDFAETRRGWLNAGDRGEQINVRMRAPGMTVRTWRLRRFGPRRQSQLQHLAPRPELIQIVVAESRLRHRAKQIIAEVIRALRQRGIAQHRLHHGLLLGRRN